VTTDTLQTVGKYVIALAVLVGCFYLIATAAAGADMSQAWTVIGLIVGWIVRDSAGQQATTNAVKTITAANGTTPTVPGV
jgi:hypothetical protein